MTLTHSEPDSGSQPFVFFRSAFTANCLSRLRIQALHRSPAPTERTGRSHQPQSQDLIQICLWSVNACIYRWKALTGDDSACECCDSQCVTSKSRRAMMEGRSAHRLMNTPTKSKRIFAYCPRGSVKSGSLLVSDQPIVEEDGFLPKSSIGVSGEGEARVIRPTDLHRHDAPWRRADFEEQQPDGAPRRPDLEDQGPEDKNESFSNDFEYYGSGDLLLEEYREIGEGGGGAEISEQQEEQVAEHKVTNIWPKVSEGMEKPRNESELKPRNDSQEGVVGEDGKTTWYFWK